MRFKNRYLLAEFNWTDSPGLSVETAARASGLVAEAIRESVRENFGAHGDAQVASSLQVKYFNPLTSLCCLRCARDNYREVWGALTMLTTLTGKGVSVRVVHVAGTIASCKKAALRHEGRLLVDLFKRSRKVDKRKEEEVREYARLAIMALEN